MTNLRIIRLLVDKTQAEVAKDLGVTAPALNQIELGKHKISVDLAEKLAAYYGHNVNEMHLLYPDRYKLSWEFVQK